MLLGKYMEKWWNMIFDIEPNGETPCLSNTVFFLSFWYWNTNEPPLIPRNELPSIWPILLQNWSPCRSRASVAKSITWSIPVPRWILGAGGWLSLLSLLKTNTFRGALWPWGKHRMLVLPWQLEGWLEGSVGIRSSVTSHGVSWLYHRVSNYNRFYRVLVKWVRYVPLLICTVVNSKQPVSVCWCSLLLLPMSRVTAS